MESTWLRLFTTATTATPVKRLPRSSHDRTSKTVRTAHKSTQLTLLPTSDPDLVQSAVPYFGHRDMESYPCAGTRHALAPGFWLDPDCSPLARLGNSAQLISVECNQLLLFLAPQPGICARTPAPNEHRCGRHPFPDADNIPLPCEQTPGAAISPPFRLCNGGALIRPA